VPKKDRDSGRSQLGYRCNLELVGQYQGQGAGWQNTWFDHCDYYATKTAANTPANPVGNGNGQVHPGTQVIDVADPAHPRWVRNIDTPALDGPWESLKVNEKRKLLAGVGGFGVDGDGPLYFDVYDISADCTNPVLKASVPFDIPVGHEGNWATDGMTYYGSSLFGGSITAIDVSTPASPLWLNTFSVKMGAASTHGMATSDDGKRLYGTDFFGGGLVIDDTTAIQTRAATSHVQPSTIGTVTWPSTDGSAAQHPIPIFYKGKPFIYFVDEGGYGASRIIDISNETAPVVVSKLKDEIHMTANRTAATDDTTGNGSFTYQGHYCTVDREYDPTAAACGYFQSGIRVFDFRDPYLPREIAYYNPPAQVAKHGTLPGSEHDGGPSNSQPPNMTADWCTSQIRFNHAADGSYQLWAQCQDNGFMTLRFTNGAYPIGAAVASTATPATAPAAPLPNTGTRWISWPTALVLLAGAAALGFRRGRRRRPGPGHQPELL
jgi:LPXTG-motif cell wall-anchored protein